jgi:hypothetical protein
MKRVALGVVLLVAGCGAQATDTTPRQPHLPRALAESWARQADAVAAALASSDGCSAQTQAAALQQSVISAVNEHRVPRQFLEPLSSGINDLTVQITCTPPLLPEKKPKDEKKKHHDHGKHGGEGD